MQKCFSFVKTSFISLYLRVLANYVYEAGAITPISEIIQHAEEGKENSSGVTGCSLGFSSLGRIVQDLWGDKIKNAKRGSRAYRQHVYLNLKRIQPAQKNSHESVDGANLSEKLASVDVPKDWTMIEDNPNCISFVRLEKWEFDKRRVSTTVVVSQTGNSTYITIKTHGCETDLPNVVIGTLPLDKQVGAVFEHIENSTFCGGFNLAEGETLLAPSNHVEGSFRDLIADSAEDNPTIVHFASTCKVLSSRDGRCSECKHLLKCHITKKNRKEKRTTINPRCNKRYLTKEELNVLLQNEKNARLNAEKRERYWREKLASEAIQLEDEDHGDLSEILKTVPKEKVPEEILCLWEQQKKIFTTKSKHGYRWHPK